MSADVNVGINEVVSVFVAKYEDGLFEKKASLSKRIKDVKKSLADLNKELINSVNRQQYHQQVTLLNMEIRVKDVDVIWAIDYPNLSNTNSIRVNLGLFALDGHAQYSRADNEIFEPLSSVTVETHDNLSRELSQLNDDLMEVLTLIKSVSRKERQIRGKISEMKLEQSGFADLMNNTEILQLVQVTN
jgi:hypothetical protein